jgi:hypothetical protein
MKPSASSSAPPDDITFFIDEALGKKILPEALRSVGEKVEILTDHFPQGTEDYIWLSVVGPRGWVVVTKDSKIRYRHLEIEALKNSGARVILYASTNQSGQNIADGLLAALDRIKAYVAVTSPPFILKFYSDGSVQPYFP